MRAQPEERKAPELTSVSADLLEPPSRQARRIIYAIGCGVAGFILWTFLTPLSEVAAGQGKVAPDKNVQAIQSVEGGYVVAILARNGDYVEKDAVIVRLDQSSSGTSREEIASQLVGLKSTATRLRALLTDAEPVFDQNFAQAHPAAVSDAKARYIADRAELDASLSALAAQTEQKRIELSEAQAQLQTVSRAVEIASEELATIRKLRKSGAASRTEVLAAEQRNNELKGSKDQVTLGIKRMQVAIDETDRRIEERQENFRSRVMAELAEAETRTASLSASLSGQQSRVNRTEIRAPMSGVLTNVKAINIGQVIKPYEDVAEIVPDSETLIIKTRIRPEDIGFVAKGHRAVIKLSAYDYSIFGTLQGTLVKIAADSNTDERGQTYYAVDVQADKNYIERRGERWPVKPGMVANVEIVTGTRTVFQYLTKPIHRMATMALRER
jgi:membrane fusion protein, adhesin transport system